MELDCRECDEGLVEFLYGEFDERRTSEFARHLERCPRCSEAAEALRETSSLFEQLEPADPGPLADDDPILAAATAKAEEMSRRREQTPAMAEPGSWQRLLSTVRSAAMRPALGTAFMVLLVSGVGLFFLRGRPEPRSAATVQQEPSEGLTQVPLGEVRAARPEPAEAPGPARPPVQPAVDLAQVEQEESEEDALVQRPPAPEPPRAPLEPRPERRPQRQARTKVAARSASAQNRSTASSGFERESSRPQATEEDSSPLVVEAQQVPTTVQAESPQAPAVAQQAPSASSAPTPVIPTPPLPQAGQVAVPQQQAPPQQQQAGTARSSSSSTPAPTRVPTPAAERYQRGMEAFRSGSYRDAAEELNDFVRSPSAPRHLVPSGLHHLALSQTRAGNVVGAARTYDQLLARYTSYQRRPQAMLEAARVYARLGQYQRAESTLRQLATVAGWAQRAQAELARISHRRNGEAGGDLGPDSALDAVDEVEAEPASQP